MDVAERSPATSRVLPAAPRAGSRHQPLLGGLLVKEGLINSAQLDRMLTLQQAREPRPLLGQMLLDEKLITSHELSVVLSKYGRKPPLGNVLIEANAVTPSQLETALTAQRKTDRQLGATLVQLGFISERQLKHALSIQLRVPFVDLDDLPLDPHVMPLISEHYARHHRVMPVAKVDGRIVLAMADPTDVEVIAEVRSCTGHPVDVVAATSEALERALARGYREPLVPAPVPPGRPDAGQSARLDADEPAAARAASEPEAPDRAGSPAPRRGGERTRPAVALEAIRARLDAIRQAARYWERRGASLEALLREHREQRAEIDHLGGKLRDARTALARAYHDLETKTHAATKLEQAYATALHDREALERSLRELQERYDALLVDRAFVIERVSAILGRLRS